MIAHAVARRDGGGRAERAAVLETKHDGARGAFERSLAELKHIGKARYSLCIIPSLRWRIGAWPGNLVRRARAPSKDSAVIEQCEGVIGPAGNRNNAGQ